MDVGPDPDCKTSLGSKTIRRIIKMIVRLTPHFPELSVGI